MASKIRLSLLIALTLAALFLLPSVSFASSHSTAKSSMTISAAFTGTVTQGSNLGAVLTGGLTVTIDNKTGKFTGTFKGPGQSQLVVTGAVDKSLNISATFFNNNQPYVQAQGAYNPKYGEFKGPFQIFTNGQQSGSGIWSALIDQNPSSSIALAFGGHTFSGPDKGADYYGAIVLNKQSLKGTFNLDDGTVLPVTATIDKNGHITATIVLGKQQIVGKGKPIINGSEKGYAGPYTGPKSGDTGKWRAYFFSF